jgi:propionyl-CoA carboxylase alpha chain
MDKILIANRGEIAVRVIKSAKKMGIKTVVIYSEADKEALHVKMADEAYLIGPAPSAQSYLRGDKVIEIAKLSGAKGIHPGYGFLSENANFSKLVEDNGLIFIGPHYKSIETMGSKLAAKEAAKQFDIPMVPGSDGAITDVKAAIEIAKSIGFPVLIKASAGGGGKGMRVVQFAEELEEQMNRAVSEAISAFGDGSVFIEKYVGSPKHIEVQVLSDSYGNTIYLFERECSVQRRHQKVLEEAPSSCLTPEKRKAIGEAAVLVAKSCNYRGAGTVEFLVDEQLNFYFLEMNTRLQVEHPVTEMITGVDLVEQQIRVARGEKLSIQQEDLKIHGHSMEIRVYAEDPLNNFLPSTGNLSIYRPPVGENIRVDNGIEEGMDVPIYYDPMLSKLVVWGENRSAAIENLKIAIRNFKIEGIQSTLPFGLFVLNHEAFKKGDFDTNFVSKYYTTKIINDSFGEEAAHAAHIALKAYLKNKEILKVPHA